MSVKINIIIIIIQSGKKDNLVNFDWGWGMIGKCNEWFIFEDVLNQGQDWLVTGKVFATDNFKIVVDR